MHQPLKFDANHSLFLVLICTVFATWTVMTLDIGYLNGSNDVLQWHSVQSINMRGWVLLLSAFIIHADAVTDCHDSLLGMGILEDLPVRSSHGTNEESFRTMSCCQSDGTCHGGFDLPQRALKEFIDPKRTSIHPRTKRFHLFSYMIWYLTNWRAEYRFNFFMQNGSVAQVSNAPLIHLEWFSGCK